MDRGAWRAAVHGVTKSRTQLSNRACTHLQMPLKVRRGGGGDAPRGGGTGGCEEVFVILTPSPPPRHPAAPVQS